MNYEELYNQAMGGSADALETLNDMAGSGDEEAQYVLSCVYDNIDSPFMDVNLGMHWLRTSADYNYEPAIKKLMEMNPNATGQYGTEHGNGTDAVPSQAMGEAGQIPSKGVGTSNIVGLFISIGLIIAGLSGEFVLRGTDSSYALVFVGCLFLIYDIVKIISQSDRNG